MHPPPMPSPVCFTADFPDAGDASISNIFKSIDTYVPTLKFSFEFSTAEIVSICEKVTAAGMVIKVRMLQQPLVKRFFGPEE